MQKEQTTAVISYHLGYVLQDDSSTCSKTRFFVLYVSTPWLLDVSMVGRNVDRASPSTVVEICI